MQFAPESRANGRSRATGQLCAETARSSQRSQADGRWHTSRVRVQERAAELERIVQHHHKAASSASIGRSVATVADDAVERALADEAPADGSDPTSVAAGRAIADREGGDRIGVEGLFHLPDPAV